MMYHRLIGRQLAAWMPGSAVLVVWTVIVALVTTGPLPAEDFGYPYALNNGVTPHWEAREQHYPERWMERPQPVPHDQREPEGYRMRAWQDRDEPPYAPRRGGDDFRYGASDGWRESVQRTQSSGDGSTRRFQEPYSDTMNDRWSGRQPTFQRPPRDYYDDYERPRSHRDPWADDWRDTATPRSEPWYGEEDYDWQRHYGEPSPLRDRRDLTERSPSDGVYPNRSRDPWEASYTPDWSTGDTSSYYDPQPFDPWMEPEVRRDSWGREMEERPWGQRRPPASDSFRSSRSERRRWEDDRGPPEAPYRYEGELRSYGGSRWPYPGLYGGLPPAFGMPWPGMTPWERLLWAAGWPGWIW